MLVAVVGGGQLGRMLALAGYPLGLSFRFLDPEPDACAGKVAPLVVGPYDDLGSLARLLEGAEVLTYEFENVPVEAARWAAERIPVLPPPEALAVAQDRLAEKTLFREAGIPVPPLVRVDDLASLRAGLEQVGVPAVLKTRRLGYDGKGQALIRDPADADGAWRRVGGAPCILEAHVAFQRELSVLGVRGRDGTTAFYPLIENLHGDGILLRSLAPAPGVTPELQALAEGYARAVMERLGYVGVLALELFERDGELLGNELAPRVHNSGHWTIEGAETSQFENHLRAILGLPLGSTASRGTSAMVNLIGRDVEPGRVLSIPGAHLHRYGKGIRPGRKVGHVTVVADDRAELERRLALVEAGMG